MVSAEELPVATQMLWIIALHSAFIVDGYSNGLSGQKSSHQECERLTAFAKKATGNHRDDSTKLWDRTAELAMSAIPLDGLIKASKFDLRGRGG